MEEIQNRAQSINLLEIGKYGMIQVKTLEGFSSTIYKVYHIPLGNLSRRERNNKNIKKENLQTAIEATKAKLHNAESERAGATPEALVMIDKKIRGLQIELKYLTESVVLLEKEEKPIDELALAKLLVLDLCEQAQNDNVDMSGNDKRLIASDRLTESIEKLELLQDMIKGHPLVFPEMEQFTKGLDCYIEAGTEAVGKATTTIREADEEIEKLTSALEVAKAEGAAEEIIELSELLEDAKKKREYL